MHTSLWEAFGPESQIFSEARPLGAGPYAELMASHSVLPEIVTTPDRLYRDLSRIHVLLTTPDRQLETGQYMTPFSLAQHLSSLVPLGSSVYDSAAGVGTLLAALPSDFKGTRSGMDRDSVLVALAKVGQTWLERGTPSADWCRVGDLFQQDASPMRVDSLVLSPPWVLKADLPLPVRVALMKTPFGSDYKRLDLFDLCVPYIVLSVQRYLEAGGYFVATAPKRVALSQDWRDFRTGALFRSAGLEVELDFLPPPRWALNSYPTAYVVIIGQLNSRGG